MKIVKAMAVVIIWIGMIIGPVYAQAENASGNNNQLLGQTAAVAGQQPAAATELTPEQLVANILKAEDAIKDISYKTKITSYFTDPAKEFSVASRWVKKPGLILTRTVSAFAAKRKLTSLVRRENGKIVFYSYMEGDKEITEEVFSEELGEGLGEDMFFYAQEFLSFIQMHLREHRATIKKERGQEGGVYIFTFDIDQETRNAIYVRETDWFPFKIIRYKNDKMIIVQEIYDVVINAGLADEIFQLDALKDTPVKEETWTAAVESVEITRSGIRKPGAESLEPSETVPGALNMGFGIEYMVHGQPDGGRTQVKIKLTHPPFTDPTTGAVETVYETYRFPKVNEVNSFIWSFSVGAEHEIVPGTWTMRIEAGDNKIAEKAFTVVPVDNIYAYVGKLGGQLPQLREAVTRDPDNALAHKNLGNAYLDIDNDLALEEYKKAISIDPQPNFYNNLCLAYNQKQEYDKALEACNQALALYPGHTSALINRGNTFRLRGEYDKAIEDYTQSLQAAPAGDNYNPPMAYLNRALAYEAKGEAAKAQEDRKKACELDSNYCK